MIPSEQSNVADDRGPDYRTQLAAERTFLAYIRTGLTFLAAGVAAVAALPDSGYTGVRRLLGAVLVALGVGCAVLARRRWAAVEDAVRVRVPIPPARGAPVLVIGVLVAAALSLTLVVVL